MKRTTRQYALPALSALCVLCVSVANLHGQPMPPTNSAPPRPIFFAVTDVDANTNESPFSCELATTNSPLCLTNVSWDPSTNNPNPIAYHLYYGFQTRVYTRMLTIPGTQTNQAWPVPGPPPVWQKTFSWLESTNLPIWKTNSLTLCTITGAPPGAACFTRSGPIRWVRIQ